MKDRQTSFRSLRVLVVDDIRASREHLCTLVRELGHEPCGVSCGEAAIEQLVMNSIDVVLLDLLMPDMDGFEVTQRVRALVTDRWLPVIVTSSLEGEEHFIAALQQGADDYLARPISLAFLDAKLRHYGKVLNLQWRLAELAQRQRAIHDNILDAVITLDGEGLIEEVNLAATRIFGQDTKPLNGKHCKSVLGASLDDLLSHREIPLARSDGRMFPAELAVSEWNEAGNVLHTLVIRDLTERHNIERMKNQFLATVSHELRTPLTPVLGTLDLLSSGAAGTLPRAAQPLIEMASRNGKRLSHLIDDILDLTKLEGNQMVLRLRPTRPDTLVKESIAAIQEQALKAGVNLIFRAAATRAQVRVDSTRFLQAMANLLSNAIKHSAPGDTVTVSMDCSGDEFRVKVRDRGPGIDPKFRAQMFEKFSQADGSDRRAQGGTGLGLHITRMLVERMGGRVEVDSEAGQGATFILILPVFDAVVALSEAWHMNMDSDAVRQTFGNALQ